MRLIFCALWLMASCAIASPELITKVIGVSYVKADTLIPVLKPLLGDGESVSASDGKLIVNVSANTLKRVYEVIQGVDKPPVVFDISVHKGNENWLSEGNGDVIYQTSSHYDKGDNQQIQVTSGDLAYIATGQNVPLLSSVSCGCFGFGLGVSYERATADRGIYILPEKQGSRVKLIIRRVDAEVGRYDNQNIDHQYIDTTTYVPIGKWVNIGSSGRAVADNQPASKTYGAGNSLQDKETLFIKVNILS